HWFPVTLHGSSRRSLFSTAIRHLDRYFSPHVYFGVQIGTLFDLPILEAERPSICRAAVCPGSSGKKQMELDLRITARYIQPNTTRVFVVLVRISERFAGCLVAHADIGAMLSCGNPSGGTS